MIGMAIALLLTGTASERPLVFAAEAYSANAARGPVMFTAAMLSAHNAARAEHGLPPLAWDQRLAADAESYARELAATRRFTHADTDSDDPQGENLWMGTRDAYHYSEMVGHWASEKRHFRRDAADWSATGDLADVGHYTQMVWKDTRAVGCAVASDASDDYLVCRYYPAGNVEGEDPLG